jgi:putative membrane protein
MRNFVIRLLVNAMALSAAAWWVPGIHMSEAFLEVLWIALVFGLVNAVLKPILKLLSLPVLFLTLGLFTFVINAALLMLTAHLVDGFSVDGWGAALIGAIAVSIVSLVLGMLVRDGEKD